jgi:hypothetical protein
MLYDNSMFNCDVKDCDRVFFDVKALRKHVMEQHADEGLRKIANSGLPSI